MIYHTIEKVSDNELLPFYPLKSRKIRLNLWCTLCLTCQWAETPSSRRWFVDEVRTVCDALG